MARQEVQGLGSLPQLMPAASPVSGFSGQAVRVGPGRVDLRFVENLGDRARALFFDLEKKRSAELIEKGRADLADGGELVDTLLENVEDEGARVEAVRRAQAAGVITQRDSPYFRLALAEAEGRRAAQRSIQAASARLVAGEHLPRPDGNGNLTGGTDPNKILDEELARFQKSPALAMTIGAAAYNRALSDTRPALVQAANDQRAEVEVEHLRGIVRDEIAGKVRLLHDLPPDELPESLAGIEEIGNRLHALGVADVRGEVMQSIARGLTLIGTTDPEQALLIANTAVGDIKIGGETLEENPRTAEILALQRHKWRTASVEQTELDEREYKKRQVENTRLVDDEIGAIVRREREAGTAPGEAARIARAEFEQFLVGAYPRAADLQEHPALFEDMRTHGLGLIDSLTAERADTDPFIKDQFVRQLALTTTREQLNQIRSDIIASGGLSGRDLQELLDSVDKRINSSGLDALQGNQFFSSHFNALSRIVPPDGMPTLGRYELEDQLEELQAAYLAEVEQSSAGPTGPDAKALNEVFTRYRDRAQELVRSQEETVTNAQTVLAEAVRNNATRQQVQNHLEAARLTPERLEPLLEEADRRQSVLSGLLNEPLVRSHVEEVVRAIEEERLSLLGKPEGDGLDHAAMVQELRGQYHAMLQRELAGSDVDMATVRDVLSERGRQWSIDVLERARKVKAAAGGAEPDPRQMFLPAPAPEGEDEMAPEVVGALVSKNKADSDRSAIFTAGGRQVITSESADLRGLAPTAPLAVFDMWQQRAYRQNTALYTAVSMPPAQAKESLEYEAVRASKGAGADLGRTYIAAVAPLGIPIEAVIAGKTTVDAGTRYINPAGGGAYPGNHAWDLGHLAEPVDVKLDPTLIPPFTTPMFTSKAQMERVWREQPEALDRLFVAWGFNPDLEQLWAQAQGRLIEATRARAGTSRRWEQRKPNPNNPPPAPGKPRFRWGYTEEL